MLERNDLRCKNTILHWFCSDVDSTEKNLRARIGCGGFEMFDEDSIERWESLSCWPRKVILVDMTTKPAQTQNTPKSDVDTSDWDEIGTNVEGFYDPECSGKIIGRVLEDFSMETQYGTQTLVKVRVAHPVKAYVKQDIAELPAGSVLAIRISVGLVSLLDCVTNQCAVEIIPNGKTKTKRGQMWTYKIRTKGERVRRNMNAPNVRHAEGGPAADDDLPF